MQTVFKILTLLSLDGIMVVWLTYKWPSNLDALYYSNMNIITIDSIKSPP